MEINANVMSLLAEKISGQFIVDKQMRDVYKCADCDQHLDDETHYVCPECRSFYCESWANYRRPKRCDCGTNNNLLKCEKNEDGTFNYPLRIYQTLHEMVKKDSQERKECFKEFKRLENKEMMLNQEIEEVNTDIEIFQNLVSHLYQTQKPESCEMIQPKQEIFDYLSPAMEDPNGDKLDFLWEAPHFIRDYESLKLFVDLLEPLELTEETKCILNHFKFDPKKIQKDSNNLAYTNMKRSDTETYSGQFCPKTGLEEGYGVLIKHEECLKIYFGQFKFGCPTGGGMVVYKNLRGLGERYKVSVGNWVNGILHEYGSCYIINRAEDIKSITMGKDYGFCYYTGDFSYGKMEGEGTMHYSNGQKFDGTFKNNRIDGFGKRINTGEGTYLEGHCLQTEDEGIMESSTINAFITRFGEECFDFYDSAPTPKEKLIYLSDGQDQDESEDIYQKLIE